MKNYLPYLFLAFRNTYFKLKIISLIYFLLSEIHILTKFRKTVCYTFKIICKSVEKMHDFFDKFAMKNSLQNRMLIIFFLMASKNINFTMCVMWSCSGNFLIAACDYDVRVNYFCPIKQCRWRSKIFMKFIII